MNVLEGTGSVWKLPEVWWTCVEHSGRWSLGGWMACRQPYIRRGLPLFGGEEPIYQPSIYQQSFSLSVDYLRHLSMYMCSEVLCM